MSNYKDTLISLWNHALETGTAIQHHARSPIDLAYRKEMQEIRDMREMRYLATRKYIELKKKGDYIEFCFTKKGNIEALKIRIKSQKKQLPEGQASLFVFDIPEAIGRVRPLLRRLLQECGFLMLQRSVWYGKLDVIDDFRALVKELNVEEYVYIYRILDEYRV